MELQVIQMVLPIVVLLALGMVCRKKQIFDMKGLAGLKSVVGDVCLPVVLFNAFFTAHYSPTVVLLFVLVYLSYALALAAGFSLSRSKAAALIASGKAAINHRECLKGDRQVAEGDVITCRGLGKCVVKEVSGLSKKGRTIMVIERYI